MVFANPAGNAMFPIPIDGKSSVTFTRIAPLSNLTKASKRHATHGSKSVPLTPGGPCVPLTPGGPCVPLTPGGPCVPLTPGGPCVPLTPGGPCVPLTPGIPVDLVFH